MCTRTLSCGDLTATIDLAHGANCISLRHERYGARILREPPAAFEKRDNPYLYGMPILFPVNRISGGRFTFEGREYVFPVNEPQTGCHLHGTLHGTPFSELEHSATHTVCAFRAEAGEYLGFPHAFELRLVYELEENGLSITAEVANHSAQNMPVFLGFHTTFNTLFTGESRPSDVKALVDIETEYERNMQSYLPTGQKPPLDEISRALAAGELVPMAQPISRHYRAGGNRRMSLTDRRRGVAVVYESSENLPFRLIYCGGEQGYICLEPQTFLANCQNAPISRDEAGFAYIKPGQKEVYRSKIYIEEL